MSRQSLTKLAIQYFTRRGYVIDKALTQDDDNPLAKKFDLIVRKGSETYPVCVKNWNRTVGVNIIINIDKIAQNAGLSNPILIAEKFSEHAKAYANRRGIKLLTRSDILRGIRTF
ncbi:MAG: restriction endonuclease [Candidatus Bathyarchaeia archaeon]|nr:restriction endonuclease [Candidatus Bathyarchaeota archaeon]